MTTDNSSTLSRRAVLAGLLPLVACKATYGSPGVLDPSSANDLWVTKLFGRAPAAVLVKRVQGPVPYHNEPPFFHGWQVGQFTWWPKGSMSATHTEIYDNDSSQKIAIFRGVTPVDPRNDIWSDKGRTRVGVWELHGSPGSDLWRMFILPDGTWVVAWGEVAVRLSIHFADDADSPPKLDPKPGALYVQQTTYSDSLRGFGLASTDLYAREQIRGLTVATYGAPRGAEVPTVLDVVYPSADLARSAADDLVRVRAVTRPESDGLDVFFRRAAISVEGTAMVARSFLPYETLASWTKV